MKKEFSGNYPIIIDGRETGRINVDREGLFWCFDADSEMCDGMLRLSIYGEDGEGYLGVMEPRDGGLRLRKKLSRAGITAFPNNISHGGRQGEVQVEAPETTDSPQTEEMPTHGGEDCTAGTEDGESLPRPEKPPPDTKDEVASPLIWKFCGCPSSYVSSLEAKSVFGAAKNVLEARDGEFLYLAVPASTMHGSSRRNIFGGRDHILGSPHLICRIKKGKIV